MQNFGLLQVAANAQPIQFATGIGWDYIRIRNESPLELSLNFTGMGSTSLAPWQRDDFYVGATNGHRSSFTGAVQITGTLQSSSTGNPSSYVVCDAYLPGELQQPLSVDLTRLTSIGSPITVTTPTNVNNSGNNLGTRFIQAETSGDSTNLASVQIFNNGIAWLGQSALPLLAATRGAYLSLFEFPGDNSLVLNGSTSGTATLYQPLRGDVKLAVIVMANFRNGNAGAQTLAFPVAFTKGAHGLNGGIGTFSLTASGVAQNISQLTGLGASGSGGTVGTVTSLHDNNIWHIGSAFDTISFAGADAGAHTDLIIIIGV